MKNNHCLINLLCLFFLLSGCTSSERHFNVPESSCIQTQSGNVRDYNVMGPCLSQGQDGVCFAYQQIPVEEHEYKVSCEFLLWK